MVDYAIIGLDVCKDSESSYLFMGL